MTLVARRLMSMGRHALLEVARAARANGSAAVAPRPEHDSFSVAQTQPSAAEQEALWLAQRKARKREARKKARERDADRVGRSAGLVGPQEL